MELPRQEAHKNLTRAGNFANGRPTTSRLLLEEEAVPAESTPNKVQELLQLSEANPRIFSPDNVYGSAGFDWAVLGGFLILMAICAITAYMLERLYRHCGFSLSNRSDFSRNFVMLSCSTMMIVTIVKSSLALSLGLVGALSIVRFRAAIKEPEELCFLFLAIGIGLGYGASVGLGFRTPEPYIPILSFAFLAGVLFIRRRFTKEDKECGYHLLVASQDPSLVGHGAIQETIRKHTQDAALKRLDESREVLEANYQVHFTSPDQLEACRQALLGLGHGLTVSMMDNRGIGN